MKIFSKQLLLSSSGTGSIEYTTPGTYTFNIQKPTRARIAIVGAGQPSEDHRSSASGSTPYSYAGAGGAAFVGVVVLKKGLYTVVVGDATKSDWKVIPPGPIPLDWTLYMKEANAYDSLLIRNEETLIKAGAVRLANVQQYGNGYTDNNLVVSENLVIAQTIIASDGNDGGGMGYTNNHKPGGASLYQGWGQGAETYVENYTKGYFKLEYI